MSATIKYNNTVITTIEDGGGATLDCSGKLMDGNINVETVKSAPYIGEGVSPGGSDSVICFPNSGDYSNYAIFISARSMHTISTASWPLIQSIYKADDLVYMVIEWDANNVVATIQALADSIITRNGDVLTVDTSSLMGTSAIFN